VVIAKHFPSDVYAGRVLGQAIVQSLLANPAFQHDLAEAKTENETTASTSKAVKSAKR
jgi:acid phosphatase (class A)